MEQEIEYVMFAVIIRHRHRLDWLAFCVSSILAVLGEKERSKLTALCAASLVISIFLTRLPFACRLAIRLREPSRKIVGLVWITPLPSPSSYSSLNPLPRPSSHILVNIDSDHPSSLASCSDYHQQTRVHA